ncbi:hypothetical protein DSO57_1002368 [Entomophthora muscae]|uniref:Uncharacterized protein n=1 Tax=Entomophthora muscae TaxID=34485 RepID=A0ACC2RNQ6_9FUNG|nr:hypothetical protein DSO57_1002368 [Entomophthora muscae]
MQVKVIVLFINVCLARYWGGNKHPKSSGPIDTVDAIKSRERAAFSKAPEALVDEIKEYVSFAALPYCENHSKLAETARQYTIVRSLKRQIHAFIFVSKKLKRIIIGFRSADDLIRGMWNYGDKKVNLLNVPGPKVNSIAQEAILAIYKPLLKAVSELRVYQNYPLVLVGHSVGGAIATLSAPIIAQYLNIRPKAIRIVTFNQPRVGDESFTNYYNNLNFNFTRVVNKDDPVPSYPSHTDNWSHVHREVFINDDNSFFLCSNQTLEDPSCSFKKSNFVAFLYRHSKIADFTIDHTCQ